MVNVTIYKSEHCLPCRVLVPMLESYAREHGAKVKIVDVDKCGTPCDWVKATPLIEIDNKRVGTLKEFKELMK